ncbi:MAG: protein-glutamate O-methyltransferase [Candidatus Omnitrophica bacterium]|nr:protein-glutamate O-methyltransferase [Candidatus Omnitrophota bacterium]
MNAILSKTPPRPAVRPLHQAAAPFPMNDRDFDALRQLVYEQCAIDIRPHKKQLMINRLTKRLRLLGLPSFTQYVDYLCNDRHREQELVHLIDAITTNKTDFFRESKHFSFLEEVAAPEIIRRAGRSERRLRIWSAACSSGEEPYSITICLNEMLQRHPGWSFEILASDISEAILQQAAGGIYDASKVAPIPMNLLRKYFLRGHNRFKIKPQAARSVNFQKINLKSDFHRSLSNMDAIFCRNVLIYFDRTTQADIIQKCWHVLRPGGYLFLGHSETLQGMKTDFHYRLPAVYQKGIHESNRR